MAFGIIQYGESASNGADSPDKLYKVFAQISSNKYWQARTSSRPYSALRVLRRIRSNRSCAFDQDLRSPIIVYNSSKVSRSLQWREKSRTRLSMSSSTFSP